VASSANTRSTTLFTNTKWCCNSISSGGKTVLKVAMLLLLYRLGLAACLKHHKPRLVCRQWGAAGVRHGAKWCPARRLREDVAAPAHAPERQLGAACRDRWLGRGRRRRRGCRHRGDGRIRGPGSRAAAAMPERERSKCDQCQTCRALSRLAHTTRLPSAASAAPCKQAILARASRTLLVKIRQHGAHDRCERTGGRLICARRAAGRG
jgi:hypothetical protein